jgi:hypothetical protein
MLLRGVLLWRMLALWQQRMQLHTFQQALQRRADALSCVLHLLLT